MDRRDLLQRIAAAGAAYWSGDTLAVEMAKAVADRPPAAAAGQALPRALLPTLAALADLVIPATKTAGAVKAGVPDFVADMYSQWMNGVERERFSAGLQALDADAKARFGRPFARCSVKHKTEVFGALCSTLADYKPRSLSGRIADESAPFFHKARDLHAGLLHLGARHHAGTGLCARAEAFRR